MKRIVGYARCSTEEQTRDGRRSIPTQEDGIHGYAASRSLELVAIHRDEAVSGKTPPDKRPGLSAAMLALRKGQADGLIVHKLDRLSRSIVDIAGIVDDFERKGWALLSVNEAIDTKTATGRMFVGMIALVAQWEREQIAERVKDGMARIAREGKRRSGKPPFGYRFEGDRVVEDAAEDHLRHIIVRLRCEGHGPRHIARTLNEAGHRNPRTGDLWAQGTVADILRTMAARAKVSA